MVKDTPQVHQSDASLGPSVYSWNSRYKAVIAVLSGSLLILLVVIGYLVSYSKQLRGRIALEKTVISSPETGEFLSVEGSFRIKDLEKDIKIRASWPGTRSACSSGDFESYDIEAEGRRGLIGVEASRVSFDCEQLSALEVIRRDLAHAPWEGWEAWPSFEDLPQMELPAKNLTFTVVGYPGGASMEFIGVGVYKGRFRQLYVVRGKYEDDFKENRNVLFLKEILESFEALDR